MPGRMGQSFKTKQKQNKTVDQLVTVLHTFSTNTGKQRQVDLRFQANLVYIVSGQPGKEWGRLEGWPSG